MRDVMLDLETFGTANDAAIVTIGACIFDADTGEIPDRDDGDRCFHAAIHLDSMTGSLDPGTVLWWLKQEQARRLLLERIETGAYEEMQALNLFSAWLQHRLPSPANYDTRVRLWSNGPTFDEVILRAAYKRYGLRFPIHYRGSRCCRTLFDTATAVGWEPLERVLTKHDALNDALHQAAGVADMKAHLRRAQ